MTNHCFVSCDSLPLTTRFYLRLLPDCMPAWPNCTLVTQLQKYDDYIWW